MLIPEEGVLAPDASMDLAQLTMIYRHERQVSPENRKSHAFISGLSLLPGSAYASTVSHDCHNLLVLGTDRKAMTMAANTLIESGGGLAVVKDGKVLASLPLPFAGLMSPRPVSEVAANLADVEEALKAAGCPHDSAEMTISLLGLVVLPELHLSNRGLVRLKDGNPPEIVSLFI